MVTFANRGQSVYQVNGTLFSTRLHKRIPLKVTLFLRALINHVSYGRTVETINVSEKGLLITCDVGLKTGMEVEVTSATRKVKVIAEVKHVSYNSQSQKWLIGLVIREKKSDWFVSETLTTSLLNTTGYVCSGSPLC